MENGVHGSYHGRRLCVRAPGAVVPGARSAAQPQGWVMLTSTRRASSSEPEPVVSIGR